VKALLLDTNILVRERDTTDPKHSETISCLRQLWQARWTLYVTTQTLMEYWSVATRPAESRGGLGLRPQEAERDIEYFLALHDLVEEPAGLFEQWRILVRRYQVSGRQVWDARIVAVMQMLGLTHLLTYNTADFERYAPEIRAWSPGEVEHLVAGDF